MTETTEHKYIKNIPINWVIAIEHLLNTNRHLKQKSPHNQEWWKKEKKKRVIKKGTSNPDGMLNMNMKGGPYTQKKKKTLKVGKSTGTEKDQRTQWMICEKQDK